MLAGLRRGLREVFNAQAVVVLAPFTASEHGFRDLFHRQIRVAFLGSSEGGADYEQGAFRADLVAQLLELGVSEARGSGVNEILFCGVAVLPIEQRCPTLE